MKKEAGEHRAPGPPPSCSTSHLAVRAGPAVERAGACTCPSLYPCPHAEKIITKYRARAHAERWLQQQQQQQQPGLCLRRRARERHNPGRNGHRAHPIFKRTLFYAQRLRVSPARRGSALSSIPLVVVLERSCEEDRPASSSPHRR